ncbi:RNA polymerase III RPC4-domain-containing protein [Fomitopsis serialis]|uniref:RNA polymerase III RPC4-domain-containing protein n=1 Tax=Fomitopsis serialis TaxID=139415 RepID=UPI00200854B3|nr:RNA polymerase III RPC4-domain-containing protein [Neoantrodia serialis]KAH9924784.1 RNA polymerase III RPC4-domain-containing protein [Neoantrodia serialis]
MPDPPPPPAASSSTPKAIPSLARRASETTRRGAARLVFTPTLPARRKKDASPPAVPTDRGRGRGRGDRARGRGRGGEGRGAAPRPPPVEMTASGPFAMGPALAGTSARRTAPRSNFAPAIPQTPGALGAGLTQTTAPALKREKARDALGKAEDEEEAYSDPDEGVEIVDMERIRDMDWMAPESLAREREVKKRSKAAKVKEDPEKEDRKGKGVAKPEVMDVDESPEPEAEPEVNLANAVDLSESEDEEELEDIIDDFAFAQQNQAEDLDPNIRQERLYFFQFPSPFPAFVSPSAQAAAAVEQNPAADTAETGGERKVTFAPDTKPAAPAQGAKPDDKAKDADQKVDGIIGQLEVYASGAVKMRLANGILMDVTAATQPSFLQQAVHIDSENKRVHVLGEVNRRFVVSPDVETLLAAMELAEQPVAPELEGLIAMDTT